MSTASLAPIFDPEMIRRYDVAGPRYTSYPTAPHFSEAYGPTEYLANLRKPEVQKAEEVSLYFHLPFCRSVCYFCACNVTFTGDRQRGVGYGEALKKEMDLVLAGLGGPKPVRQLHWGGGTPTFSPPEILDVIAGSIRERWPFAPGGEIGVEVDPRETTTAHLEVLAKHGFNRVSMGVQDFDPGVQRAVHRNQPYELTRNTIVTARALGFNSVNVDLIYGLPRQTMATFSDTISRILELSPDRVALFNFAYLPDMVRHQRVIKPEELPPPGEKLRILGMAIERFTSAGYVYIGMDHFARPDDELALALKAGTLWRNFQGYTTHAGLDLYGFGVTAISQIGSTYSQNLKDVPGWEAALAEGRLPTKLGIELTAEDRLRRAVIYALMCQFRVDKARVNAEFGIDFDRHFATELEALAPLEADGLVRRGADAVEVAPAGRLLVRNVAMTFDAYFKPGAPRRFSRTI